MHPRNGYFTHHGMLNLPNIYLCECSTPLAVAMTQDITLSRFLQHCIYCRLQKLPKLKDSTHCKWNKMIDNYQYLCYRVVKFVHDSNSTHSSNKFFCIALYTLINRLHIDACRVATSCLTCCSRR